MSHTLLICGHYPLPEDTGVHIRTMNFVRFFRQRGTVDIAYSRLPPGARPGSPIFGAEHRLTLRAHKSYKAQLLHRFISRIPLPIYELSAESCRTLSKLIGSQRYDYILVRYLYNAAYLLTMAPRYRRRVILDYDDLLSGSLYDSIYASEMGPLKSRIFRWNRKRLVRFERQCLDLGASLFCSDRDRLSLRAEERRNAFVVPNVHHDPSFATYDFGDGFSNRNTLLFVGALNYQPNVEGLTWFIESIWPSFAEANPDARLLVAGRCPADDIKRLCATRADIELHGDVPDLKPYYRQSRAVVVPVLAGGGTRIKILEAALARRPVLSTPLGAAGLDLGAGRDLLSFEDADEFAARYAELADRERYRTLVRNASELVRASYSPEAFDRALAGVVNAIDGAIQHPSRST